MTDSFDSILVMIDCELETHSLDSLLAEFDDDDDQPPTDSQCPVNRPRSPSNSGAARILDAEE
jgi:hypothetical protein